MGEPQSGFGDDLAQYLKELGIDESRYKEIKEKFGLPPECWCAGRRAWFNKVGKFLGYEKVKEVVRPKDDRRSKDDRHPRDRAVQPVKRESHATSMDTGT